MRAAAITRDTGTATGRLKRYASAGCLGTLAAVLAGTIHAQGTSNVGAADRPVFLPGIRASTTYSDNPLLRSRSERDPGFVHEVSPYLTASSSSPRANYRLDYQLRSLWIAGTDNPDTHKLRHSLNARGTFALVDDRLWLDMVGYMGTVNSSLTGPLSPDPASSFVNAASARHFSISPWYRDRIGNFAEYQLRYLAAHTGGNTDFLVAKLDQRATAAVSSLRTNPSPWSWSVDSGFQRRDFGNDVKRDRVNATGTLGYRLNPMLRVYGLLAYERIEALKNKEGKESGSGPGIGFEWTPSNRLSVSGSFVDRYYGTSSEARIAYSSPRSTFGLQYSRGVFTSSDASLLSFDPNQLTSGQLGALGVNPVLASLISRGIVFPPGTSFEQSLITDAAMLDRRLTLFYGLTGGRNSLALNAFMSNRTSTTEFESTVGSGGTGSASRSAFSGEIRERGVIVTYQHRLDARTSVDLTYDQRHVSSPTAGFSSRYSTVRAGVGTQVTSDATLFAGIRRTAQRSDQSASRYHENAVYGGVDVRFR
ncbi:MAG: TIGR03016 family PEP-CTERM system-associated outer membrane protein [Burkholderiaceae bacterium]